MPIYKSDSFSPTPESCEGAKRLAISSGQLRSTPPGDLLLCPGEWLIIFYSFLCFYRLPKQSGLPGFCDKPTSTITNWNQTNNHPSGITIKRLGSREYYHFLCVCRCVSMYRLYGFLSLDIIHLIRMRKRSIPNWQTEKKSNPQQHFRSSPIPQEKRRPGNPTYNKLSTSRTPSVPIAVNC